MKRAHRNQSQPTITGKTWSWKELIGIFQSDWDQLQLKQAMKEWEYVLWVDLALNWLPFVSNGNTQKNRLIEQQNLYQTSSPCREVTDHSNRSDSHWATCPVSFVVWYWCSRHLQVCGSLDIFRHSTTTATKGVFSWLPSYAKNQVM